MTHFLRAAERALAEATQEVKDLLAQIHRHRRLGHETVLLEAELRHAVQRKANALSRARVQRHRMAA